MLRRVHTFRSTVDTLLLLLLLLFTANGFSIGGSSPYSSTDKTNTNTHKRKNTKTQYK